MYKYSIRFFLFLLESYLIPTIKIYTASLLYYSEEMRYTHFFLLPMIGFVILTPFSVQSAHVIIQRNNSSGHHFLFDAGYGKHGTFVFKKMQKPDSLTKGTKFTLLLLLKDRPAIFAPVFSVQLLYIFLSSRRMACLQKKVKGFFTQMQCCSFHIIFYNLPGAGYVLHVFNSVFQMGEQFL